MARCWVATCHRRCRGRVGPSPRWQWWAVRLSRLQRGASSSSRNGPTSPSSYKVHPITESVLSLCPVLGLSPTFFWQVSPPVISLPAFLPCPWATVCVRDLPLLVGTCHSGMEGTHFFQNLLSVALSAGPVFFQLSAGLSLLQNNEALFSKKPCGSTGRLLADVEGRQMLSDNNWIS